MLYLTHRNQLQQIYIGHPTYFFTVDIPPLYETKRLKGSLREILLFFGNKCTGTILFVDIEMMVCMILCYLYSIPSRKYPNEQYNIENFGVLMCPLSILIFFFFFFLGPFGVPLGRLAHLIKNSPESRENKCRKSFCRCRGSSWYKNGHPFQQRQWYLCIRQC